MTDLKERVQSGTLTPDQMRGDHQESTRADRLGAGAACRGVAAAHPDHEPERGAAAPQHPRRA